MMKEGPHLKREGKKETAASTRQPLEKHQKGKIGFSHGQAPRYVAFDIETTGLYPQKGDRIIEIGAVVLDHGSVVQEFHSL
ncbi:MAG: exonuclease domain-containing protein, partial [Thermodesulfobacteriota bacterium]|nr:exonuclease domain-containing protein [Thermodesulfobacteriota bacterium]